MAGFDNISKDKAMILSKIVSDKNLCKAVYYNEPNFLDQPDISHTSTLIYNNIFPYYFVPDQDREISKTYITLSFRNIQKVKGFYKTGDIFIHIFTHKDLFRTDYGMLRVDYIADRIDNLFNGLTGVSIGKMDFKKMDEFVVNNSYSGNYLNYRTYDFN